jgi:hypothetical protein
MRKKKDPDPYLRLMDPDPDREAQKHADHADPVPDPDPQHCCWPLMQWNRIEMKLHFLCVSPPPLYSPSAKA